MIEEQVLELNPVLKTKKEILAYIDALKAQVKLGMAEETLQEQYAHIEGQIMAMGDSVKANTIVYLKNELKTKLGKYGTATVGENQFLKYFKETYANAVKTKAYTWVLTDVSRITDQQILDTLKTINTYSFKNKLTKEEKQDILPMVQRIVDTQNIRYINQVRSMEGIRKVFNSKIVEVKGRYVLQKMTR